MVSERGIIGVGVLRVGVSRLLGGMVRRCMQSNTTHQSPRYRRKKRVGVGIGIGGLRL